MGTRVASTLAIAVTPANAEAILAGRRAVDVRRFPPKRLPARAYLAVVGARAVVGECVLGEPVGKGPDGTLLPISAAKAYRRPKPIEHVGLAAVPRSFRYVGVQPRLPSQNQLDGVSHRRRTPGDVSQREMVRALRAFASLPDGALVVVQKEAQDRVWRALDEVRRVLRKVEGR